MYILMIMIFINMLISLLLILINYFVSKYKCMLREKMSSFECGFDSFVSSRLPFSIHFFLIGILFLIFDIEVVLIFPMINSLNLLSYNNWLFSLILILIILYLGLEFEKKEGSLNWCM